MKKKSAHKIGFAWLLIAIFLILPRAVLCVYAAEETAQDLQVPSELGIVHSVDRGTGPLIFHIQAAHGNYEAQKKIQSLLHYLKNTYGIKTILVEGSAAKLDPVLLHFFPTDKKLTMEFADSLAKKSLIKGAELFLLEEPEAVAYGIENMKAYVDNGKAFQAVLVTQEKSKIFLDDLNRQIERLSSPYLNRNLKIFLKRLNDFEAQKTLSLADWLAFLMLEAQSVSGIDFSNAKNQIDWPMFSRVYRIQQYQAATDEATFAKESEEFLAKTESWARTDTDRKVVGKIQHLLSLSFSKAPVSDPGLSFLLERMLSFLPASFDFDVFPSVKQVFAKSVFESELSAASLLKEMDQLIEKISLGLAATDVEKNLLLFFKNYRLLQRLFSLDFTPEDYKVLSGTNARINFRPKEILRQFQSMDKDHQVDHSEISQAELEKVESLFDLAMGFYEGAKTRDPLMLSNIVTKLTEMKIDKAVVITGGFHAGAFRDFFKHQGYSYALIAPKFAHVEGRDAYIQAAFKKGLDFVLTSTWEEPFLSDPTLKKNPELMSQIESEALLDQTLRIAGLEPETQGQNSENFALSGLEEIIAQHSQFEALAEVSREEMRLAREVLDGMLTLSSMNKMKLHKSTHEIAMVMTEMVSRDSSKIKSSPFRNIPT